MKVEVHEHPEPALRTPWWEWACNQCTPELYNLMTARDPRVPGPASELCPFCMMRTSYPNGQFRDHLDDLDKCRASGLTILTAQHLLASILRGWPFDRFIRHLEERSRLGVGIR